MSTYPRHIGKYELQERLEGGGMSETWKAFETQLRRSVIVKLLYTDLQTDPDFAARFLREAPLIASLKHPNIVQVRDFQVPPQSQGTSAYVVTDYIEGPTLADYIASTSRVGKFPSAADIVHLFASISVALDYAHQKGVIHRSIKPASILLNKRVSQSVVGEPMLTDFGIAQLLGASTGMRNGVWLGNPLYISPEQAQGYVGNEYSDLYSLGVILYEICTGVPPFQGNNPTDIVTQHINAMPTPPVLINRRVPPPLTVVILRSLAKDPAARFPSASAMAAALAEAFNLPVPESLKPPSHPMDAVSEPTYYKPQSRSLSSRPGTTSSFPSLPNTTPSPPAPALPIVKTSTPPPSVVTSTQRGSANSGSTGATPVVAPMSSMSSARTSSMTDSVENAPTLMASPSSPASPSPSRSGPPSLPSPLSTPSRRRRGLIISAIVLLIFVLVGSGLATFFLLTRAGGAPPIVGHAIFISSGQMDENSTQGLNDELLLDLQNVPQPAAGKSYYGWLLGDKGEAASVSLGKVTIKQENGRVLYADPKHTNLLATVSRLLVTEEDAASVPQSPSRDQSTWRYNAGLPQIADPADAHHYSALDHLRDLLSGDPKLDALGLPGGLEPWLSRNTEKILDWTASARDDWNTKGVQLMRDQFVRILDYLDGTEYLQTDVPGTPVIVNKNVAQVPLLEFDKQNQNPPGYLDNISGHLQGIVNAPGISSEKRALAAQLIQDLNNVKGWLKQVHDDAKQLLSMTDEQLLLPSSLSILDHMETQAFFAYVGRLDSSTDKMQGGVAEIHYAMQRLATFDITQYQSS